MLFFTADQHFGHGPTDKSPGIIGHCNRPFANIEENDETIIANHNEIVTPQDCTIHNGDFCWHKKPEALALVKRLNGSHVFIKGSHDAWLQTSAKYQWRKNIKIELPEGIRSQFIVVAHDAMRTWHRSHHGAWQCHGHSHGRREPIGLQWDVGVDNNGFYPVSVIQLAAIMRARCTELGIPWEQGHK